MNQSKQLVVLGICGLKRSGKDTVGDICCSCFGMTRKRFADPLKNMVKEGFGFSEEQMHDSSKDQVDIRYNITPRQVLQFVGTEVMQFQIQSVIPNIGRNFWSSRLLDEMKKDTAIEKRNGYVITDMRFLHEYHAVQDFCKEMNWIFKVIHVYNPTVSRNTDDEHISEQEWKTIPPDMILLNNSSVDHLKNQVYGSLKSYFN